MLYYFKNINSLTLESTNFSLNDTDFSEIKKLSKNIDSQILLLFWQFTIKTLEELDVVSNQNLTIEMFLIRLLHVDFKKKDEIKDSILPNDENTNKNFSDLKNKETIDQIRNITQEKKEKLETQQNIKAKIDFITSFNDLLEVCSKKKKSNLNTSSKRM